MQEGDTDNTPYGLGTYASRSTPVAGAATAMICRELREKARTIAAHLLEASEDDLEWEPGRFCVKGSPDRAATIQDDRLRRLHEPPRRAAGRASRASTTTTRRT